jgi:hypothetical protein
MRDASERESDDAGGGERDGEDVDVKGNSYTLIFSIPFIIISLISRQHPMRRQHPDSDLGPTAGIEAHFFGFRLAESSEAMRLSSKNA